MITFLSAGPRSLALINGSRQILHDSDIAVVANTAMNFWVSGNHSAPDVDAATFLFAGILDTNRWRGIRGDTYTTHNYIPKVAGAESIPIGDRARAVQIARTDLLRRGMTLTEAVQTQCRALSIGATILPATEIKTGILVDTGTERLPLFEYLVCATADTEVRELIPATATPPVVTDAAKAIIEASDAVVIGPDNPARGILSILDSAGMRDLLRDRFVVAISPFSGDVAPDPKDAALIYAIDEKPTAQGVFRLYEDVIDLFVQDLHDPDEVTGSLRLEARFLHNRQAESLAWDVMAAVRHAVF